MKKISWVLIVGFCLLILILSGNKPLSFIQTAVSPSQYIGDLTDQNFGNIGASDKAVLGDYSVVVKQFDYYIVFSNAHCDTNDCGGIYSGIDKSGCSIYSDGSTSEYRSCTASGGSGWICNPAPTGCGYRSGYCSIPSADCTSISNQRAYCTGYNTRLYENNFCVGEQSDVTLHKSLTCNKYGISCGQMDLGGTQRLDFSCANEYDVYYKGQLIDTVLGSAQNSNKILIPTFISYFQGAKVEDTNNADLIIKLHSESKYRDSPRACLYTTNEFDFKIDKKAFDINVTKEVDNNEENLKVVIANNYGSDVFGRMNIEYSLETPLGVITRNEQKIVKIPVPKTVLMIPIEEEMTTENINAKVNLDVLLSSDSFFGINVPSIQCLTGNDYGTEGGKLVPINSCEYLKIGSNDEESFIIGQRINTPIIPTIPTDKGLISTILNFIRSIIIGILSYLFPNF